MNILAISGSASEKGSNYYLLKAIADLFKEHHSVSIYDSLSEFQLFTPGRLKEGVPENIRKFKEEALNADVILISTPEYTHNIPAVLKNMIEWCTHSGEFSEKKVLPITFTPQAPRGEYAMQSLLFSLNAIEANVIVQIPLYKTDVEITNELIILSEATKEVLVAAFDLL